MLSINSIVNFYKFYYNSQSEDFLSVGANYIKGAQRVTIEIRIS